MNRGLFLIASLALSSALYAQDSALFSRQQVLDLFAQYNPSVLQKAKQDAGYKAVLEQFLDSYQNSFTRENRFDLIAAVRNFDNSLRLQLLTEVYLQRAAFALASGTPLAPVERAWRDDATQVMAQVWGVSLQAREAQLQYTRQLLDQTRRDAALSAAEKKAQTAALKTQVKQLKQTVRALKKNAGALITGSTQEYMAGVHALAARRMQVQEEQARQAANLHIKTNHKKPVAK